MTGRWHATSLWAAALAFAAPAVLAEPAGPPPNAGAAVDWNAPAGRLQLRYHDGLVLDATVRAQDDGDNRPEGVGVTLEAAEAVGDKDNVEQRLVFRPARAGDRATVLLTGTLAGSGEAFPAETEGAAQKRFPLVRNSVGLSRNLRNNAVYDRRWDWVLLGPAGATRMIPAEATERKRTFAFACRGGSVELAFRPRFYQKHRNLARYEPWTYRTWKGSVTGYCTWWAYKHDFKQTTLDELVEVFVAKKLPDFGYHYIQLDDTYQIGNGSCPTNWLTWNPKFPGGPAYALKRIRNAGMKGGIWVHRIHRPSDPHVADIGQAHPDWFVRKADGSRLAGDGFQPEHLANHSSYEGVVWRNDPDHCDILGTWLTDEDALMPVFGLDTPAPVRTIVRPALCSIAGGVLMVSDKVDVYRDDVNLEGMKRSAPVLSTVPGQLYDPGHGAASWWLQEIDRPFEHWNVLTRIQHAASLPGRRGPARRALGCPPPDPCGPERRGGGRSLRNHRPRSGRLADGTRGSRRREAGDCPAGRDRYRSPRAVGDENGGMEDDVRAGRTFASEPMSPTKDGRGLASPRLAHAGAAILCASLPASDSVGAEASRPVMRVDAVAADRRQTWIPRR